MRASLAFPGLLALGAVALTAAANGAYFPQEWGWPALAFALTAILAVLVRDRVELGRLQLAFLGALGALALWTLLSIAWSPSATEPVLSFERVLVYVLFVLALLLVGTTFVLDGVLVAAAAVCAYALATRHGGEQLSGPIGYWNGLGALAAIGCVLALRSRVRLVALAVLLPALYLTSSRGSVLALAAGVVVYALFRPRLRAPVAAVVLVGALVVALQAGSLWSSFTAPLPANGGDLQQRLGSASSNGRTEYWRVAWRETAAHPLLGGGAGSYERWWHRLRRTPYEARNAHNLYLETLAELGPLGLALLLALVAIPFAARRSAAGLAGWTVFAVHAALDWDWQLPAVTLAALACAVVAVCGSEPQTPQRPLRRRGLWLALLAPAAAFAIVVQVGNSALAGSEAAANRDDAVAAARLARRAHTWAPWSAQLALGDVSGAVRSYQHGLDLDPADWSLWAGLAEAETGAARAQAAAEAHRLNPLG